MIVTLDLMPSSFPLNAPPPLPSTLQHYDGDAQDLSLDFTLVEEMFGEHRTVELRPGGASIAVTNENKLQYIHAVADYKLNRQVKGPCEAGQGREREVDVRQLC